jgi:hypothetical protein
MKKWKETKFKKFLDKAASVVTGDVASIGLKVATGNISGAIGDTVALLKGEDSPEANALLQEFELKMKEFEVELLQIEADDRDSARRMQETALKEGDKFSSRFIYYLASFWSLIGAVFIIMVFFIDIPEKNIRLIDTLEGFLLGTIVSTIIGYFFGGVLKDKK